MQLIIDSKRISITLLCDSQRNSKQNCLLRFISGGKHYHKAVPCCYHSHRERSAVVDAFLGCLNQRFPFGVVPALAARLFVCTLVSKINIFVVECCLPDELNIREVPFPPNTIAGIKEPPDHCKHLQPFRSRSEVLLPFSESSLTRGTSGSGLT
jgi:hypothetical protein